MPFNPRTKWKRLINEISFLYDEVSLIDELTKDAGIEFESYYRAFCAKNNVDRNQLNTEHRERIKELYGKDPEILPQDIPVSEYSGDTSIVLSEVGTELPAHSALVLFEKPPPSALSVVKLPKSIAFPVDAMFI